MFIEEEWLNFIEGKTLYYPAAGNDYFDALNLFKEKISTFSFCDLHYPRGLALKPLLSTSDGYQLVASDRSGKPYAQITHRKEYSRQYRWLPPSKLTEIYIGPDEKLTTIIRRRGFGEFGLAELNVGELGVFMHRGDSTGEGGSNLWFLANRTRDYPPCSMLFDVIASKVLDKVVIVSDGSNTRIPQLKEYQRYQFKYRKLTGSTLYEQRNDLTFAKYGFEWKCIGWMTRRYGPTLIWGLERT
jgi:hypothetical protein